MFSCLNMQGTKNKAENGYDEAVLENAEFETYYKVAI